MSKKPKVVVFDKAYIPKDMVNVKKARSRFTHVLYDDKACSKCPELNDRHSYVCDNCPAYHGTIKTYKEIERNGVEYIGLPLGQKKNFFDYIAADDWDEFNVLDGRYDTKFDYTFTFGGPKKGVLRDYQQIMCDTFLKKRYGLLESPPRSGKTMSALYIGITYGRRMLVVASQNEFLDQFEQHVREYSNLNSLEKKHGLKLCGRAKTYAEFKQYQITTATVQTFYSEKGQELLKRICKFYGMVWFDEIHRGAATVFSKVISAMPIKVKWGATGTVERKDGKHKILYDILGPVVAGSTIESLTPIVKVTYTDFKPRTEPKMWVYAMKWLANCNERNELIVDSILRDINRGHSIIVPCVFRDHIALLTRRVNAEFGSKIADSFMGGSDKANLFKRESVLDDAKSGKIKCVIGTRSILQLGLNVPRWSCLSGNSLVPTSEGLKKIKHIEEGELIHNGYEFKRAIKVGKSGTKKLVTLQFDSGYRIRATQEHEFPVVSKADLSITWTPVSKLQLGDVLIQILPETDYANISYVPLSFEKPTYESIVKPKTKCSICENWYTNLPAHYFYSHPLEKREGLITEECKDHIRQKSISSEAKNITYPNVLDEDLAWLVGMLITDGSLIGRGIEFYNKNPKVIAKIKKLMFIFFNLKPSLEQINNVTELRYHKGGPHLKKFFKDVFNLEGYSYEKSVPDIIIRSRKSVVAAFLAGHLDGDGGIQGSALVFRSNNLERLYITQQLILSHFNLTSYVKISDKTPEDDYEKLREAQNLDGHVIVAKRKHGKITVHAPSSEILLEELSPYLIRDNFEYDAEMRRNQKGFRLNILVNIFKKIASRNGIYHDKKGNKIEGLNLSVLRHCTISDLKHHKKDLGKLGILVPNVEKNLRKLMELKNAKLITLNGKSEPSKKAYPVYDITMEGKHQFVANGFLVHNCVYEIFPISNKPNLKQETSRVRTPMEGKMQPEIKFFVDDMSQSLWCFKSSLHHCQQFGYLIDPNCYDTIGLVLSKVGTRSWLGKEKTEKQIKAKPGQALPKINGKLF